MQMKNRKLSALVLVVLVVLAALSLGCPASTGTTTARQSAHQALDAASKSVDLAMTFVGQAYQSGAFGPPGSPKAENVRATASTFSKAASAAIFGWSAALESGSDTKAYVADLTAALAGLGALIPPANHSALHRSLGWHYVMENGGAL
jgi:hypothetical protein